MIALAIPASASAQAVTLESLLARFAALPGLEARFREEKRIALLSLPVRSEGRIWFAHPDRLMRRVEEPDPSAALIASGQLRMRSGGRTEELSIDTNPVLRGFVESFRAVLAGDQATLERYYAARLEPGEGEAWTLTLTPRDEALRRFLREIRMRGHGVTIEEMRMVEVSGDETRTEFYDVQTTRRFSDAEAGRIFRIP
ncbi:MAG: outer membrane lipoprotein carrier protein LolA [Myxococcales bacterium]|nr:outer membrane lipoprotein carrier protein LolA [Myxococcales bacterium]